MLWCKLNQHTGNVKHSLVCGTRANHMSASQVIKTLLTLHLHTSLIYILLFELLYCVSIAGLYLI